MTEYSNRTHPIFQGTTNTNSVNLGITTRCTMNCPNCSVGVPTIKESGENHDSPINLLAAAGLVMSSNGREPLHRVHLTGGEPTYHAHFEFIAHNVLGWFLKTKYLTIETNGTLFRQYKDTLKECFDLVFITHYVKDAIYPDNFDNTEIIEEAKQFLGDKLIVEPPVVHTNKHSNLLQLGESFNEDWEKIACSKWSDPGLPCAWYENKLYPCCVSFGINRASGGILVSSDWREQIVKVSKGCANCCFKGT